VTDPELERLRRQAEARLADGTYPAGIDDHLFAETDRRMRAAATQTTELRAALARLRDLGPFEVPRHRGRSRVKNVYDNAVHRVLGYAFADIVRQLERYRAELDRVLEALVESEDRQRRAPGGGDRE
jgi:hypothetical protein